MTTVKIKGMRCGHCVASVTKALSDIDGVVNVQVNLEKGEATYDEAKPVEAGQDQECDQRHWLRSRITWLFWSRSWRFYRVIGRPAYHYGGRHLPCLTYNLGPDQSGFPPPPV